MNKPTRKGTLKAIAWSAAQGWGTQLIGIVTFAFLARYLEPADFGLVAIATIFTTLIQTLTDQGMTMAIIQKEDLSDAHLSSAFYVIVAVGVILTLSAIGLAPVVAHLFQTPDVIPILQLLSLTVILNSFSVVFIAFLMREMDFRSLAIRSFASLCCGGIVGITMAVNGYGAYSLIGQLLAVAIVQLLVLVYFSRWRPSLVFSVESVVELYRYGVSALGINLCEFLNRQMDNLVIGYFLGPVALGYYAIAYKLYTVLTGLISGISNVVVFSAFSRLQSDIEKMRKAFYQAVKFTSLVTFPFFVGSLMLAALIVTILMGDKWTASIPVYQVLAVGALLETIFVYNGNVMMAMGKPHWKLGLSAIYALVNCVGYLIAVNWGIAAVASVYVIRIWFLAPLPMMLVKSLIQIDYKAYVSLLKLPFIGSLVMAAVLYIARDWFPLESYPIVDFVSMVFIGAIVYLFCLVLLDRSSVLEIVRMGRSVVTK